MGMESYNIIVLLNGVSIKYEDCYQKLIGKSVVKLLEIEARLRDIGVQHIQDLKWIYDDYLELFIYQGDGYFQGIEIKGCLSWLNGGVNDSFKIINDLKEWYDKVEIYILGQKVEISREEEFYKNLYELYNEKIKLFNKQFNNIKLKATCGEFYKEINRQSKWYYKLFNRNK